MKIKEKKVLVFGSGISGEAACSLLLREGAEVVLYDGNDKLDREEILSKIPESGNGSLQILLGTLADRKKGTAAEDTGSGCYESGSSDRSSDCE